MIRNHTLAHFTITAILCILASDVRATPLFSATSETKSTDISAFTKWTSTLTRHPHHFEQLTAQCITHKNCKKQDWEDQLQTLKTKSTIQQIKGINHYINQAPYVKDIVNWGMEDYWETLFEFFTRNGDCEDYAIAKYLSLKKLGFDTANLRIVVLNDDNLGVLHSVLAVYEGSDVYILDNQIKTVLKDTRIHHYTPIYSINETAWWRHLP